MLDTFWLEAVGKELLTFGPIAALLLVGLAITLRSGPAGATAASDSPLPAWAVNAGQTALCTLASVVVLLAINQVIGTRLTLSW